MKSARVLLVEPNFVLRRTVVLAARELGVAEIEEAASWAAAERALAGSAWDAVIVSLDDDPRGTALIQALREGRTLARSTTAVGVVVERPDAARIAELQALRVRRVVLRPFKVKQILEMVTAFVRTPEQPPSQAMAA